MFKRFENVCHLPTGQRGKIIGVSTYGFCGTKALTEYTVRLWDKSEIKCKACDLTHCLVGKRNLRLIPILPTGGDAA